LRLLQILNQEGEEARVVGGAVRNALLSKSIADIDIATTAAPKSVMARVRAAGLKTVPTGIAHGTVTVLVAGEPFEVTTLRADVETDGRHAKVRFTRDFEADAKRRDFTINALSVSADGTIHDYTDGLADLAHRRIRFIGEADQRIAEDYLRILRFFRFHAAYGEGPLDRTGYEAAIRGRHGLTILSRERIAAEMLKLLTVTGAAAVVEAMSDAGLLTAILGGIGYPARLARLVGVESHRREPADGYLRLAALAVAIVEDVRRLREALRLSNEATKRLDAAALVRAMLHARPAKNPPPSAVLRELIFLHGPQAIADALMLAHADSNAPIDDPRWMEALDDARATPAPELPISGADILARGIAAGPRVGAVLKQFQADWIRAGFPREPKPLAELLDRAVAMIRKPPS
jgi:poly(A) polymerase